jgi:hypothetical protein
MLIDVLFALASTIGDTDLPEHNLKIKSSQPRSSATPLLLLSSSTPSLLPTLSLRIREITRDEVHLNEEWSIELSRYSSFESGVIGAPTEE